jgi:hypothetical protein
MPTIDVDKLRYRRTLRPDDPTEPFRDRDAAPSRRLAGSWAGDGVDGPERPAAPSADGATAWLPSAELGSGPWGNLF